MNELTNSMPLNEAENSDELKPLVTATVDHTIESSMNTSVVTDDHTETIELTEEESEIAALSDDELPNYAQFNKQQLVEAAVEAVHSKDLMDATRILKAIKPVLDQLLQEEYNTALQSFIEEGGIKEDFEFNANDGLRDQFNNASKELKNKKTEEKQRQEAEKQANLKQKEIILEKIKQLTEGEETKDSLATLKGLQAEWKQIRNIPKEHIEQLWESYHLYIHKFYDNLSMFHELKDLDRRKNLDQKIELTKKVSELALEPSTKKVIILIKKYQEEWKNIGPVPKESNDDIWNRFKLECDRIYEMIKAVMAENERKREENLTAKKALLAKALELSNLQTTRIKDWLEATQNANQLMDQWKQIGMVPLKHKESIWEEFRSARNRFYNNKNDFFKKLHAERNHNLKVKTELCEKAEQIAAQPLDWNKQTDELKKMQDAWKQIGPVHEKVSDAIWKRFRTACDSFFEKKAQHFSSQVEEQKQNLEVKNRLLTELEALMNREDGANIIQDLKLLQEQWNKAGFVPLNAKEAVNKKYSELTDKVFNKFKQAHSAMRDIKDRAHFEAILQSPNGDQRIKREEKFLLEKIRGLKGDIDTWDNNLGFFAKSKGENPMTAQIKDKIEVAQKQIKQLEDKLKLIKNIVKESQAKA
ncbi:MAG: DUF349 domain-containing protein [Bacteroidia bacterium]|nr:DUF349 domain-containing protein [Bacteroidia bacterium]